MDGVKIMGRDMEKLYAWRKENIKRYSFELNKTTEKEVFEHLEKQPNKRDYLISLIKKDMKK